MRRLPALVAALLLPAVPPMLLGTAVVSATLLLSQAPAQAQSAEGVAKIAQAITVRIEGATPGSGVLMKHEGNRYTVLTAWHVVSGERPGEEVDVYTADGQRHQMEQGSIKRIGEVDMAVLTFTSSNSYELAKIGDVKSISSGEQVFVAGFPTGSSGRLKYDSGKLVANAAVGIDQGYQLLYTNDTTSGMSGGVVLKADGTLIGMHGRGELDEVKSQQAGFQIKTGTNQGVPILYWKLYSEGLPVVAAYTQASTVDDYLAKAKALLRTKGNYQQVVDLMNFAINIANSDVAYFYRGSAKYELGDKGGALIDLKKSIEINPRSPLPYYNLGNIYSDMRDYKEAIMLYGDAIRIYPNFSRAYMNRGVAKYEIGDFKGSLIDLNFANEIDPLDTLVYKNRMNSKFKLQDFAGALRDADRAIYLGFTDSSIYSDRSLIRRMVGDKTGALEDINKALSLGMKAPFLLNERGLLRQQLGDVQGSIADFSDALAIKPNFDDALVNRGIAKMDLNDYAGAIQDFDQAILIDPKADVFKDRARAKILMGNLAGALDDFGKSLQLNPKDADTWGMRGLAKYTGGDKIGACKDTYVGAMLGSLAAKRQYANLCR